MAAHPLEMALTLLAEARDALAQDLKAVQAENRGLQEQASLAFIAAQDEARSEIGALRKRLVAAYSARAEALHDVCQLLGRLSKVVEAQAREAELIERTRVQPSRVWFKVARGGGVSVYGFGRYPVTLFENQWVKLLANKERILDFLRLNAGQLKRRA